MSAIGLEARRRLTLHPDLATAHGAPVLQGWRRLDGYTDPKLVGTDPTGQAWVIERVEANDGPAWLVWTLEDFAGCHGAEPIFCPRRSDAIDYASNAAHRAQNGAPA